MQLIDVAPTIASLTGAYVPPEPFRAVAARGAERRAPHLQRDAAAAHSPRLERAALARRCAASLHRGAAAGAVRRRERSRREARTSPPRSGACYAAMRQTMEQHPRSWRCRRMSIPRKRRGWRRSDISGSRARRTRRARRSEGPHRRSRATEGGVRSRTPRRHAGAIAKYQAIVAEQPAVRRRLVPPGIAQERIGALQDAVESYRAGDQRGADARAADGVAVGSLHLRLRQLDEADAHARLALKTQPGAAHHLLGRVALARGDGAGAEREARLAMEDSLYREAGAVLLSAHCDRAAEDPQTRCGCSTKSGSPAARRFPISTRPRRRAGAHGTLPRGRGGVPK